MIYALTLTASPHKDRFKKLSWSQQKEKFRDFFNSVKHLFTDFIYVFEVCPTSGIIHAHLIIQPESQNEDYNEVDILGIFTETFIGKFGYWDNPTDHFYVLKPLNSLLDYYRWETYIYKTFENKCVF